MGVSVKVDDCWYFRFLRKLVCVCFVTELLLQKYNQDYVRWLNVNIIVRDPIFRTYRYQNHLLSMLKQCILKGLTVIFNKYVSLTSGYTSSKQNANFMDLFYAFNVKPFG